jgi:hypothetical protein
MRKHTMYQIESYLTQLLIICISVIGAILLCAGTIIISPILLLLALIPDCRIDFDHIYKKEAYGK